MRLPNRARSAEGLIIQFEVGFAGLAGFHFPIGFLEHRG